MNFKFIKGLGVLIVSSMAVMGTACGDDDDDDGGNGPVNNGGDAITNFEGTRLTGVGYFTFEYDDKGRLSSYVESYGYGEDASFDIDYSKGLITITGEDYDDNGEYNFKLNGSGYISELSASWNYVDEDGYSEKGSGKVTLSYNGDGYITSVKSTSKVTYKEDGYSGTSNQESNITYTWKNGNLTKVVDKGTESYTGGKDTWTDTMDFTYSGMTNVFKQYTYNMSMNVLPGAFAPCGMVGLMGKGPAMLPSSMHEVDEYYESGYGEDSEEYNESYSYSLNDNGSIEVEYEGSYPVYYYYNDSKAMRLPYGEVSTVKLPSIRSMFVHKHHRNRK